MEALTINTALIDRMDLTALEKLCCIILARLSLAPRSEGNTLDQVAALMGCTPRETRKVLESLLEKGLLLASEAEDTAPRKRRVLKKGQEVPAVNFEAFDEPKPVRRPPLGEQLEALRAFVAEPATDATLRILLNMAGGDVDRVRTRYQALQSEKCPDVLETLMQQLQLGEAEPPSEPERTVEGPEETLEPETRQVLTQINQKRIAELYHKSKGKR